MGAVDYFVAGKAKAVHVLALRNGYRSDAASPTGYRTVTLMVEVQGLRSAGGKLKWSDDLDLKTPLGFIGEVELVLKEFLTNKKSASLYHKIKRAETIQALAQDNRKFL